MANSGTMRADMSGMQVVFGDNANPIPTPSDFERSLSTMTNV